MAADWIITLSAAFGKAGTLSPSTNSGTARVIAAALEVGQGEYADLRHHYVEVGATGGYKPVPN